MTSRNANFSTVRPSFKKRTPVHHLPLKLTTTTASVRRLNLIDLAGSQVTVCRTLSSSFKYSAWVIAIPSWSAPCNQRYILYIAVEDFIRVSGAQFGRVCYGKSRLSLVIHRTRHRSFPFF